MKDRFEFTVGYELSAIVAGYEENPATGGTTFHTHKKTVRTAKRVTKKLARKYPDVDGGIDGHCMEFQSPVFTTWSGALQFYRDAWKLLRKERATPHHPVTVCGGGHLHLGISNQSDVVKVLRDSMHRPYLPWVFTQPDDTDSCDNLVSASFVPAILEKVKSTEDWDYRPLGWHNLAQVLDEEKPFFQFNRPEKEADLFPGIKQFAVVPKQCGARTVEFRCVEAPRNQSELKDQIEFFTAYASYVISQPLTPRVKLITLEELQEIKPGDAIREFNALLDALGLSRKRYKKYVDRNLKPRWKLGRERI